MMKNNNLPNTIIIEQTYNIQLFLSPILHPESHNEYVVVNNDALIKCNIPSYVADFVTIVGWVDSEGNSYRPSENTGNEE